MNKGTKIVIAVFALLVIIAVPLYFYMRQNAGLEGTIQVKGAVNNPANVTFNELKTFTSTTVQVTLTSSGSPSENGIFNYTGIPLRSLLEQADVIENATSVYVQASDGYGTTITIQDAQNEDTILAYQKDDAPLTALSAGGEGPIRLIICDDEYAQRWVKGVSVIEVR